MIRSRLFLHGQPLIESDLPIPGFVNRILWRLLGGRWISVGDDSPCNDGHRDYDEYIAKTDPDDEAPYDTPPSWMRE